MKTENAINTFCKTKNSRNSSIVSSSCSFTLFWMPIPLFGTRDHLNYVTNLKPQISISTLSQQIQKFYINTQIQYITPRNTSSDDNTISYSLCYAYTEIHNGFCKYKLNTSQWPPTFSWPLLEAISSQMGRNYDDSGQGEALFWFAFINNEQRLHMQLIIQLICMPTAEAGIFDRKYIQHSWGKARFQKLPAHLFLFN